MRVEFAVVVVVAFVTVVMMMVVAFFGFECLYAFGCFGEGNFALFDGTLHVGGFQTQAVQ